MSRKSRLKRAASYIKDLHDHIDPIIKESVDENNVSCKRGCSTCCNFSVMITIPEALNILIPNAFERNFLYSPIGARIRYRLKKQVDYCLKESNNAKTWFVDKVGCMFLSNKNECMVYERRPTICRTHYVLSDSSLCGGFDSKIEMLRFRGILSAMVFGSKKACDELGVIIGTSPMPIAIDYALTLIMYGRDSLRNRIYNSVHADNMTSFFYWGKRFMPKEEFELIVKGMTGNEIVDGFKAGVR